MVKRSEIKSIVLLSISSIVLIINIFFKQFINEYSVIIFLGVIFALTFFLLGFEKARLMQKRSVLTTIFTFTISFTIIIYGAGLLIGFAKSPYSLSFIGIVKNVLPLLITIGLSELLRYNFIKKNEKSKLILLLTIILFTLIDVSLMMHLYHLSKVAQIIEMITVVVVPSVAKNYVLCDMAKKYGYESGIIYQFITNIGLYILPVVPSYGPYLDSVFNFLQPLAVWFIINLIYQKTETDDVREKHLLSKVITGIFIMLIVLIIALYSNLFRYWIAVIGSGSMSPTIEVGDAIIIDKSYQKHLDKLKKGDILVFQIHNIMYTHRITDIKQVNGTYSIFTKGDRKGQAQDTWTVTNDDVVGVVKMKIPFIGKPSVWLNQIMEGRRNGKE